jgi:hypothetical protein
MDQPARRFNYANVMSSFAMLFALTALVTGSVVAANNKASSKLPPNSVGPKQIKPGGVSDPADIKDQLVDTAKIKFGAIKNPQLGAQAVQTPNVANDAINTDKIANSLPAAGVGNLGLFDPNPIAVSGGGPFPFDSEKYDSRNMHSNSTNNTRVTVPEDGIYMISGQTNWSASAATTGYYGTSISVNGTAKWINYSLHNAINQPFATALELNAGDYVEFYVANSTDAATDVQVEANVIWLTPGP